MSKLIKITLLICSLIPFLLSAQNNGNKNLKDTKQIEYIPEMFHQIDINEPDLDLDLIDDFEHLSMKSDSINIEIPQKIVYRKVSENFKLTIPIRFTYKISNLQKANNENLKDYVVCVRNLFDSLEYKGRITVNLKDLYIGALLIREEKRKKNFYKKVRRGKVSPDQSSGGGATADILQFVSIPIKSGKYEVYMMHFGLESNHKIVEIEFKE